MPGEPTRMYVRLGLALTAIARRLRATRHLRSPVYLFVLRAFRLTKVAWMDNPFQGTTSWYITLNYCVRPGFGPALKRLVHPVGGRRHAGRHHSRPPVGGATCGRRAARLRHAGPGRAVWREAVSQTKSAARTSRPSDTRGGSITALVQAAQCGRDSLRFAATASCARRQVVP